MSRPLLEMRNITKSFSGVKALDDVSISVGEHEIRALVGENGAGKSTLMNVLSGVYPYGTYSGEILFDGTPCAFRDVGDSERNRIVIIHQELALISELSIAENMFLGNERARGGVIDWNSTYHEARERLNIVGLDENPATLIGDIGVGKQQLVEIAKALTKDVRLLILDEPTAALNDAESEQLLQLLLDLKTRGVASILISHKLNEVVRVADAITVIRDGRVIETLECDGAGQFHEDRIIKSMVGRPIVDRFPARDVAIGAELLRVEHWTVYHPDHEDRKVVDDVSISLREGEVVGLAGLMGAGRTELAMSLFGRSYGRNHRGRVLLNGQPIELRTVTDAIDHRIAYVTEDRKSLGLILSDDIRRNISLPNLTKISRGAIIDANREVAAAKHSCERLSIRSSGIDQVVERLSGGNQQKVVLGKWLMSEPRVLLLDEPTRGIDVGAKYEIYTIINQLAAAGTCLLLISSELPELLGMCDRIYVVNAGRIAGEVAHREATQESIMKIIMTHQRKKNEEHAR